MGREYNYFGSSNDYYGMDDYELFYGSNSEEKESDLMEGAVVSEEMEGELLSEIDCEETTISDTALQQRYYTPLGKTPNADELSYYKFDTDRKEWWGVNDWRLKGDPKFKADMNKIAKAGIKLQSYLAQKYGLDQSRLKSDITFGYSENEGEFARFKLNMIYISKNGSRIPVSIPFGYHSRDGNGEYTIGPMVLSDIDNILNTNCYAEVLGIIGNIDYENDFIKAIIGNGYRPIMEQPKVGDIAIIGGKHAMTVTGFNEKGELLYRSTNRGAYTIMEDTFSEINEWQFNGGLLIEPNGGKSKVSYLRKQ